MKRLLTARTASIGVLVLALLAAGGSYALASGGGTIHACVKKGSHVLYTGGCKKGDKKLSWNRIGPPGPRGATGAKGDTGPQGPSNGFSTYSTGSQSIPNDNKAHTIASLAVPSGSYMVTAKTEIYNSTSSQALDGCELVPPGGSYNNGADIDESGVSTNPTVDMSEETLSLVGPLTTGGGTISLQCVGLFTVTSAYYSHLTAIKLATVTGT